MLGLDFTVVTYNLTQNESTNTSLSLVSQVRPDSDPDKENECLQTANVSILGMSSTHAYREFQQVEFIYAGLDKNACRCLRQLPLYKPLDKVTANISLAGGIVGFVIVFFFIGSAFDRCIYGDNSKVEQEILREFEL